MDADARGARTKRTRVLKTLFALAMFAAAIWVLSQLLRDTSAGDIWRALAATPPWAILLAAIATPLSYLSLAGSEWLALAIVGKNLSSRHIAHVTIVSYTATNALGFSLATGAVARLRYYPASGMSHLETAVVMLIAGAAVTVSGFVTAGLGLLLTRGLDAWMYALGAALAAIAVLWVLPLPQRLPFLKQAKLTTPSLRGRLAALASGVADWVLSGFALYILMPDPSLGGFAPFIGVFILGSVVSAASGVPGGIGVFEAVVLALSHQLGASAGTAAALLLYRAIYALIPFTLVALTISAHHALERAN